MKKIILLLIFLFSGISSVLADDAYLKKLEVEGFKLSPSFNKYNNIYTLLVDKGYDNLNIIYELEDDNNSLVDIIGNNNLIKKENEILINVYNQDGDINEYKIIVSIEKEEVFNDFDDTEYSENSLTRKERLIILIVLIIFVVSILVFLWYIIFIKFYFVGGFKNGKKKNKLYWFFGKRYKKYKKEI